MGVGSRIEIWSKEKWEPITEDVDMDDIMSAMEEMGFTI